MFKVHPRTPSCTSKKWTWLIEQDSKGVLKEIKLLLYAKFPIIGIIVIKFIKFTKSQRLSVTLRLILENARKEAENRGISNFHASRAWVENFLR